jgi:8-oxo-dGTP diphosphatase
MAAAWAVIERDGRILLVQRGQGESRPGQWCLPGGRIHSGEDPAVACVREAREETGLTVTVLRPLLFDGDQRYFACAAEPGDVRLQATECQAFAWVAPHEVTGLGPVMDLRRLQRALEVRGKTSA